MAHLKSARFFENAAKDISFQLRLAWFCELAMVSSILARLAKALSSSQVKLLRAR